MRMICFVLSQGKFQAFYQYAKSFNSDDFDYEELKNSDFVFMRWKVRYFWIVVGLVLWVYTNKTSKFDWVSNDVTGVVV